METITQQVLAPGRLPAPVIQLPKHGGVAIGLPVPESWQNANLWSSADLYRGALVITSDNYGSSPPKI